MRARNDGARHQRRAHGDVGAIQDHHHIERQRVARLAGDVVHFKFLPLNEAHLSPVGAYDRFHNNSPEIPWTDFQSMGACTNYVNGDPIAAASALRLAARGRPLRHPYGSGFHLPRRGPGAGLGSKAGRRGCSSAAEACGGGVSVGARSAGGHGSFGSLLSSRVSVSPSSVSTSSSTFASLSSRSRCSRRTLRARSWASSISRRTSSSISSATSRCSCASRRFRGQGRRALRSGRTSAARGARSCPSA